MGGVKKEDGLQRHQPFTTKSSPEYFFVHGTSIVDPEKSKWEITTVSNLQVFIPLVGIWAPILDPGKS